jgi:hypothetical protein
MKKKGGWKTNTGSAMAGVGLLMTQTADSCPFPDVAPIWKWIGALLSGIGIILAGYGLGDKIERKAGQSPAE